MWPSEASLGKKRRGEGEKEENTKQGMGKLGGYGGRPPLDEDRNVTEKAEPLILDYCLNIPPVPIMRFNTKIEISTEFCLWKHNSEKAHVQIENPGRGGTGYPSLHDKHPQLRNFPPARFQDTVGKNRPLILKIYSTQHNPGFSV